ncbi:transcriptional regulator, XRE family [Catenulispora acidiphila DSM 44928]|uniref:Transcriptional regulator, XRE family n=2 Tax=Catenulispora TaxID=414878 RepID=C7PYN8_CATAD|nr:transcriptional regulator, XRE family [Catenulispora acidiphila DSM 44928]
MVDPSSQQDQDAATARAVARAVAELRRAEGLTLDDLADRAGLHRTSIGLIERGERLLSLTSAAMIASAFGMRLSDLIAYAEREETLTNPTGDRQTPSGAVVIHQRTPKRMVSLSHASNDAVFRKLTGMGVDAVLSAVESTYETMDLIDDELIAKDSPPMSRLVELANLSSMIGNLLGAGLASASAGAYMRNRPHAFPDLVPLRDGLPDLELKTALEANRPKGHLPKAGTYITFRYVLADRDGRYRRGKESRGDTAWIWEVRAGSLGEEDFAVSSTAGDSGKTAQIRNDSLLGMMRIYYVPELLPYASRIGPYGEVPKDSLW